MKRLTLALVVGLVGAVSLAGSAEAERAARAPRIRVLDHDHSRPVVPGWGNRVIGDWFTSIYNPAISWHGPMGAGGPSARTADPILSQLWRAHPSTYISGPASRAWNEWANLLRKVGGPTSDLSILGKWFNPLAPEYRPFIPRVFRPGERYALLAFSGSVGVNGLRGIAGDTGAHGFNADRNGNYRNQHGRVVRTFVVGNGKNRQARSTFELYDEKAAKSLGMEDLQDTSFAVAGSVRRGETDAFGFESKSSQKILVAVHPEKPFENYELVIKDARTGKVLAHKDHHHQLNHVQLDVEKGARLIAEVRLLYSQHLLTNSYKLAVEGEID